MKRFQLWQTAVAAAFVCGIMLMPLMAVGDAAKDEKAPANAAVVNGKEIAYKDFEWELDLYIRRLQSQGMQIPEHLQVQVRQEVLDDLVNRELIFQESAKQGITIKPEQVDQELAAIKQRYPEQKQFDAILESMQMTEEKLKRQIAQRSAITALIEAEIVSKVAIGDKEVKSFYDDNPNLFERPEEVRARHILIKVEPDADAAAKAEARKTLDDIKVKLAAGEDFAALAEANSQCPSASNGGDLGFFSKGKMVPAFEKAAFALAPNAVSDVVETDFGYHLIQTVERRDAGTMSFDEVQPKIATNLRNEKIQSDLVLYLEKLRKDATVETFVK
jgi:peptidyl-prolyl cis-trans isomerase C